MNTAEKKLFISKIESENDENLAKTLNYFRSNSDLELIPSILGILQSNRGDGIKEAVLQLCLDIKQADAAVEVFDYLKSCGHADTRQKLLSVLWQTGQDLSARASDMVDLLITDTEFKSAFDCLTLLENCTPTLKADTASQLRERISLAKPNAMPEIIPLLDSAMEYLNIQ